MPRRLTACLLSLVVFLAWTGGDTVLAHPLEGRPAPTFRTETAEGKQFDLAQVKASVIVLDFWATWCPPCRKGLPLLQQFHDWTKSNKKPVAVFAVNVQEDRKKVHSYWKKEKFTMPVILDGDGRIGRSYAVSGIPQTVVIYKGKVVSVHVGYTPAMVDILKAEVEKLLAKSDDK